MANVNTCVWTTKQITHVFFSLFFSNRKFSDAAGGRYCQIDPRDVEAVKTITKESVSNN